MINVFFHLFIKKILTLNIDLLYFVYTRVQIFKLVNATKYKNRPTAIRIGVRTGAAHGLYAASAIFSDLLGMA